MSSAAPGRNTIGFSCPALQNEKVWCELSSISMNRVANFSGSVLS